jgi:hypothetical protein
MGTLWLVFLGSPLSGFKAAAMRPSSKVLLNYGALDTMTRAGRSSRPFSS